MARRTPAHGTDRGLAGARTFGRALLRTHWLFTAIATVSIAVFIFLIPAGWGLDEQGHVNRAYQLSEGVLMPSAKPDGPGFGGQIPTKLQDFQMLGWAWSNEADKSLPYFQRQDFRDRALYDRLAAETIRPGDPTSYAEYANTGISSPVAYLPAAVGFAVARAMGVNVEGMFVASRVVNGAMYIGLGFLALWLLRRTYLRWFAFCVALIPTAIFQASLVTSDTYTNAISLLFFAAIARLALDRDKASKGLLALAFVSGIGLCMAKPTYAILCLTALLLPAAVFGTRRRALLSKAVFAACVGVLTIVWLRVTADIADVLYLISPWPSEVDPGGQVAYLLDRPGRVVTVLLQTNAAFGPAWVAELPGQFGYNNVRLAQPFSLAVYAGLGITALASPKLPRAFAVGALLTGLGTCLAVILSLYVTFNPVGGPTAAGVHPRYFIPVLPYLFIGAASLYPGHLHIGPRAIAWTAGLVSATAIASGVALYAATLY